MTKPRIPNAIDTERLQAMQMVARMKEAADRAGVGFIGGFISPDGQKFVMSNMDPEDQDMLMPDSLRPATEETDEEDWNDQGPMPCDPSFQTFRSSSGLYEDQAFDADDEEVQ
jgi:hypothetical protein